MEIEWMDQDYAVIRIDALFGTGYHAYTVSGDTLTRINAADRWYATADAAKAACEAHNAAKGEKKPIG